MGQVYDRVVAAIKSAADTAGDYYKLALGTTGNTMEFPVKDPDKPWLPSQTEPTGQAWGAGGIDTITEMKLQAMAAEIERSGAIWAHVDSKGTGVSSTFTNQVGFTSVGKNEPNDTLTFNLSTAYASASYIVMAAVNNQHFVVHYQILTASAFVLSFYNTAGALQDINSRDVRLLVLGPM